ncbi:MAG TPA: YciI family protein [Polyangiales bacterium]|nr:YciI family protein [Polyangiales bacterium]
MKFIVLAVANKDNPLATAEYERYEAGVLPKADEFVEMGKFQEELVKAGVMVAGEGLQPSSKGARITFGSGGKTSIKNGPFTESKELIAGFSIIQVKSLDEAIAWMSRSPSPEGTTLEIRQLFTDDDFASVDPTGELREQDAKRRERADEQHRKS